MKVLVDIGHPAHVHFFRSPIAQLLDRGHVVMITSRAKECAVDLLDAMGLSHDCLSIEHGGTKLGMLRELVSRNRMLAGVVRRHQPDVLTGVGGIFVAQVGRLLGVPSVVFYDTENAHAQNLLTYPFASEVVVPACYRGWTPPGRTVRYPGYHELSYLHPEVFLPDRDAALAAGLALDRPTVMVRVVAWHANHDVGEFGWSQSFLEDVVQKLTVAGTRVLISAEGSLPRALDAFRYSGPSEALHHVLAHCAGLIGESATMASEAVALGVPAVYVADKSRGYIDEQADRWQLLRSLRCVDARAELNDLLSWMLELGVCPDRRKQLRNVMLDRMIRVDTFAAQRIAGATRNR